MKGICCNILTAIFSFDELDDQFDRLDDQRDEIFIMDCHSCSKVTITITMGNQGDYITRLDTVKCHEQIHKMTFYIVTT
jgi:hypothetical protein